MKHPLFTICQHHISLNMDYKISGVVDPKHNDLSYCWVCEEDNDRSQECKITCSECNQMLKTETSKGLEAYCTQAIREYDHHKSASEEVVFNLVMVLRNFIHYLILEDSKDSRYTLNTFTHRYVMGIGVSERGTFKGLTQLRSFFDTIATNPLQFRMRKFASFCSSVDVDMMHLVYTYYGQLVMWEFDHSWYDTQRKVRNQTITMYTMISSEGCDSLDKAEMIARRVNDL